MAVTTVQTITFRGTPGSSGGAANINSVCFRQRGQVAMVPTSSAWNSIDPPHSLHTPVKRFVWFIALGHINSTQ
jgi:hypothetical protein